MEIRAKLGKYLNLTVLHGVYKTRYRLEKKEACNLLFILDQLSCSHYENIDIIKKYIDNIWRKAVKDDR